MKKNLNKTIISADATVKEALEKLGQSEYMILFTINDKGQVIGCVTDGDIRRGFLKGETLQSKVHVISRKSFVYAHKQGTKAEKLDLLKRYGVRQLPILDSDQKLLDIVILDDFLDIKFCNIPIVIMAGGKGTRLLPYTEATPKPLLKVGEKPIIETLLTNLVSKGFSEFHLTVNYLADQIVSHFGDGSSFGAKINYIYEKEVLGTAGSLSLLKDSIKSDFLVLNADVLADIDLELLMKFHQSHQPMATVCSKLYTMKIPYGVISTHDSEIMDIEEKPELSFNVSSGVYCLSPKVFDYLEYNTYIDMPALLKKLLKENQSVKCFHSNSPWIDIGSVGDFEKAQKYIQHILR